MIIGIITRKSISEEGHNIDIIYKDIISAVKNNGGIPIGIILDEKYKNILRILSGVIFQGGDEIGEYDLDALKYLYKNDIPVLGICLGMQEMGILFNGKLNNNINHKKKLSYAHSVYIKGNSKLSSILNEGIIKVNSRHKDYLICTDLSIVGISNDGIIEAIEDKNKRFFIGVQWHPESMIEYDSIQNKIFKKFINACQNK